MGWQGYVQGLLKTFKDESRVADVLESYGMLRKHEPGGVAEEYLIYLIRGYRIEIEKLRKEMAEREVYTTGLETKIAKLLEGESK